MSAVWTLSDDALLDELMRACAQEVAGDRAAVLRAEVTRRLRARADAVPMALPASVWDAAPAVCGGCGSGRTWSTWPGPPAVCKCGWTQEAP